MNHTVDAVRLVAAFFLFLPLSTTANAVEKPNVLMILVDDLKPAIGCYGDAVAKTPSIDALAARGMRFDLAYCNQAVCAPSRFTLMLGSHSTSTGLYGLGSQLREIVPGAVTMPQYFARHGYHTQALGKVFHIGHGNHGDPPSFSEPHFHDKVIEYVDPHSTDGGKLTREEAFFTNQKLGQIKSLPRGAAFESPDVRDTAYADGRVAEETIQRLRAAKRRREKEGAPFFIAAGFARPHLPFSAPKKYWDLHSPANLPMPQFEDLPSGAPQVAGKRGGEITNYKPVPEKGGIDNDLKRKLIHGYYASTSFVDAQIGNVIAELDRLDLAKNTIVVLWGDHGFHLGDLGIWTKHTNYEQANRIPIVFVAPGVTQPNSSTKQLTESVDIFPTLAELAGLPAPTGPQPIDGVSLAPVLKNPTARVRDHAYHAYPRRKLGRAIRTERYRFVEWKNPGDAPETAEYELYDYQVDPLETENLAVSHPQIVAMLKTKLAAYPEPVDPRRRKKTDARTPWTAPAPKAKFADHPDRWSADKAWRWYDSLTWPVGANFVPSTAINQLEMWQADTFDPETIERELGWAAAIGMNTMRVFLHDLAWKRDPDGFFKRVDEYLEIADRRGIRTMFVIFDGVWHPYPRAGKQPEPKPGLHNSGWVQSPGRTILEDSARHDELKPYVQAVLRRYKDDPRVLVWDLFNEPDNSNSNSYGENGSRQELDPETKRKRALELLEKTFVWARDVGLTQPLTCGVWVGDYLNDPDPLQRLSLEASDVISFHTYAGPDMARRLSENLLHLGRPVMCTEYMSRGNNSTFESILPIFHQHKVGAYNWGLVDGKSQTIYPWDSWQKAYTEEPRPWHHDIFRRDGTPYAKKDVQVIQKLTRTPPTRQSQPPKAAVPPPRADIETGLQEHDRALFVKREQEPMIRQGDWTVNGKEAFRGVHIRLDGSLFLPEGAELTLEDCTLEIVGDYSREHSVEWKGGSLITRNCTLGGSVNESGNAVHTVFHLYEGNWEATDTTVQYAYGISFHWKEGRGVLRGVRLKAGPRPDAIILSGEADVTLIDSDFPIGLGIYVNKGGSTTLDLQPNQPITATYDRATLLPGVNWRLKMQNTRVARWFAFVRQIGMHHDPAEITLKHSKDLIVSLLGHNLTGEINLSNDLLKPLRIGNVTLKTAEVPAGISMYALYLSGDENDVSVTGKSHICELMHRGGKLEVLGTLGQNEISIGCTTLELSGNARMTVRNVHMGRPLGWREENSIGEATIADSAKLTGRDISVKNVRFRTEDSGQVILTEVNRHGRLETREVGGLIQIDES